MQTDPTFPPRLPAPPYFAVIFSSQRTADDGLGYAMMADRMEELARQQSGFLGVESVRAADGQGITVSCWNDLDSIQAWRNHAEHRIAQETGRNKWYESFQLQICRVERSSTFRRSND